MALLAFVSVVLMTTSILLYLSQRKYNYWKTKSVPFATPTPFLGTFVSYIWNQKTLGESVRDICKLFPKEPLVGGYLGTDPVLIIQDPQLVKLVMMKDSYYFSGDDNQKSKNWRVIMQPLVTLFSEDAMRNMFYLIQNCVKDFEKLLREEAKMGEDVEVRCLVSRFVMDCFGSCVFGTETKAMGNSNNNAFNTLIDHMFEFKKKATADNILASIFQKSVKPADKYKFLEKHLSEVFLKGRQKARTRPDFINLLLEFQKKNNAIESKSENPSKPGKATICLEIKDDALTAQSIAFFAAGFETATTIFSLTLYELAKNPESQMKALAEIDAVYKPNLDYDCLLHLPYLEQCISETLRLHPMLTIISRVVLENYKMPNRIRLDRGVKVFIPVLHLHHNPRYFPDPENFRPERFSRENRGNIVPYTYLPFGAGPASCLGQRYAKLLILSGLVSILHSYHLSLAEGTPSTLTLHPASEVSRHMETIRLKITPRVKIDV